MLTVKTSLRQSATHGMGVFTEQFIPAGTVVWKFQADFDFRVSEESVAALPETARQKLLHYSAKWGGGYVISADDARFLNHSERPNLRTHDEPDCDIAIRDIQIGEELLEDYREFDDTFAGRPIDRGIADIREPSAEEMLRGANDLEVIAQGLRDVAAGRITPFDPEASDTREPSRRLPLARELTGSDPNFTGGLSTEEYVAEMRGGGDTREPAGPTDKDSLTVLTFRSRALVSRLSKRPKTSSNRSRPMPHKGRTNQNE